jgi:nucleoside-diphosphate-sugar epimerase
MPDMRVAVTGASGFIGIHLCRRLGEAGHETHALVRRATPALELPNVRQRELGELRGFTGWAAALEGAEAVVHLAAYAHGRGEAASLAALNVEAALAAAAATRGQFIFVSSAKVYGEESGAQPFDERSALHPAEPYAASKAAAEAALRRVAGLQLTVLRPPLVYGAGVKANFLALMRAVGRGVPLPLAGVANRRSLIYAGNLCDAIAACLGRREALGRAYPVTDGPAVSTPELCRALGEALGRPARLFAFPPRLLPLKALTRSLELDDGAIRRELGWRPPFAFEEGLRSTAQWYLSR